MSTLLDTPMTALSAALRPKRPPTPEEDAAIRHVRELAVEFAAGRLPIDRCRRHSTGAMRWMATRFTGPDDPSFQPLMQMLDALIATATTDGGELISTQHGYFSRQDLVDAEVRIVREDGNEVIILPIRHPWKVKPDPDKGIDGQRLPAVYRAVDERKPSYGHFAAKPAAERKEREVPWWEEGDGA